jgi:hypothetical protein
MRRLAVFATIVLVSTACSEEPGSGSENNGTPWNLDAGRDGAVDDNSNANGSTNGTPNGDPNGSTNGDPSNAGTNGDPNNTNPNNTTPDMGNGGADAGTSCTLNSQCGAGLICCAGFDGMGACEAECFTGGLCGDDDGECADGEECCDFSEIGAPNTCLENCRGGNNNQGMPCDNNSECQEPDEVCCPGLDGMGTCTTDCFSGGLCENEMDCEGGQMCCDFNVTKVCLDQCSF